MKVSVDDFSGALQEVLENYGSEIDEGIKKTVNKVGKEVNNTIKEHISFKEHTGDYVKSFRVKNVEDRKRRHIRNWCVINGQYRLTHLLENGHVLRNGGRSKAYPHIKYGEEIAQKRMVELSEEVIKNAGN